MSPLPRRAVLAILGALALPRAAAARAAVPAPASPPVPGRAGGDLRILIPRERDIRLMSAWGYARLVGYRPDLTLVPDLAEAVEVEADRVFIFRLRAGHRWSDGAPFTAEDFRYFWQDVALNPELSPGGPPVELLAHGELPEVSFPDAQTIVYAWAGANPGFLHALAQARDPFIYRPAHYLKRFHLAYGDPDAIARAVAEEKLSGWAALHNRRDNMYNADNPELPSLQPWVPETAPPAQRFVFVRNPHFHRVDADGTRLPYIDRVVLGVADASLIPAKTVAGDSDLQSRGLGFRDVTALKAGEGPGGYRLLLWPIAKGAQVAFYPNLNVSDPVWRTLNRDRRFRIALSQGINREEINRTLYFGLGTPGGNGVLPFSPLFDPARVTANAGHDPAEAARLLDEIGLTARDAEGIRLLPDGRPLEIVVETAGENSEEEDVIALVAGQWQALGIKAFSKPSDRAVLRNRVYAGETVMSAASGWDNGIPVPAMAPEEQAPVRQETLCWPKWGQHVATRGQAGEAPDLDVALELLELFAAWGRAGDDATRAEVWRRMLEIHAREVFVIGTVSGVQQPIAVSAALRNVPDAGVFAWDPGAQFGMYRMDMFWLER